MFIITIVKHNYLTRFQFIQQQTDMASDYLNQVAALLGIFSSLSNGEGWYNSTNWGTTSHLSTWFGISGSGESEDFRVTTIVLPNNNLSGSFPPCINDLPHLITLVLDNNPGITSLPSFHNTWQLYSLSAFHCSITTIGNMENAESLHDLNLAHNNLTELFGLQSCSRLRHLNIQHNMFSHRPRTNNIFTLVFDYMNPYTQGLITYGDGRTSFRLLPNSIIGSSSRRFGTRRSRDVTREEHVGDPDLAALLYQPGAYDVLQTRRVAYKRI